MSAQTQRLVGIGAVVAAILGVALDNVLVLAVDESPDVPRFLGFSLLCVGAGIGIFLILAPWLEDGPEPAERLARYGLGLALVGLASMIVFFTGLPLVLGGGAFLLGMLGEDLAERERRREGSERRRDETQSSATRAIAGFGAERASLAWTAAMAGALVFVAGVVLFVVLLAT
jgi:hypothetical protein